VTALASFLQARAAAGRWLVRIDDLDRARCPPGMDAAILRQLEAHGLQWDGTPRYQSAHVADYREAIDALRRRGLLYACHCTRAVLRQDSRHGPEGPVYAGTCRDLALAEARAALRLRIAGTTLCIDDGWQGRQCRELATDVGDFVVRRADGIVAYQLACAVDEHAQQITEVVRGADLLGSTFCQVAVLDALALPRPAYRHLPVLTDSRGRKLSKQNYAAPVEPGHAGANLWRALVLLGHAPPRELEHQRPADVLRWARENWRAANVPRDASIRAI